MKQSIYLHKPIVAILRCYGSLDDVVNKILQSAADGQFDVTNKPAAPNRTGAGRYDIEITEPNYLELLNIYGPFSSTISLRRLLYWFVENEIYNELGWEQVTEYEDKRVKLFNTKLSNALNEMEKAKSYALNEYKDEIECIVNDIKRIKELANGR